MTDGLNDDRNTEKPISVTRLSVPLVLISGLLVAIVVLPFTNLTDRVERAERTHEAIAKEFRGKFDSANYDALSHDVASVRRELDALTRLSERLDETSKERHEEQRKEIERNRQGSIDAYRSIDGRVDRIEERLNGGVR